MVLYLDTRKVIHPEAARLFVSSTERHHALTMGVCDLTPYEVVDAVRKGDLRMYERMVEWAFDELAFTKYVDENIIPMPSTVGVKKLIYVGSNFNSADKSIVSGIWREWFREAARHSVDRVIHKKTIEELAQEPQGLDWREVDSLYQTKRACEQAVLRKYGLEDAREEEWDERYGCVEVELKEDKQFVKLCYDIKELEKRLDPDKYTQTKKRLLTQLMGKRIEQLDQQINLPGTGIRFGYALGCVENRTGNFMERYAQLVEAHNGLRFE